MMYSAIELHRNGLCLHPDLESSDKFSFTNVRQMAEDSPEIGKHLGADPEKRDPKNKNRQRIFDGGILYFLPGNTGSSFRGRPADDVIVDDADGFPSTVREKSGAVGGAIRQKAEGRAKASSRPKYFYVTTPTDETGFIHEVEQTVTEVFRREFRCPYEDCDQWQHLEFNPLIDLQMTPRERAKNPPRHGLKWDSKAVTREEKLESLQYCCKHCERSFTYASFPWMDRRGRWASNRLIQDDKDGTKYYTRDGEPAAAPKTYFCVYDGLISYDENWTDLAEKYLIALESFERTGDDKNLVSVVNEDFASVYKPAETGDFTVDDMLKRCETWDRPVPYEIDRVSIGVDLGNHYYSGTFIGHGHDYEKWVLDRRRIIGSPIDKNCEGWTDLEEWENIEFLTPLGKRIKPTITVMDGKRFEVNVRNWCAKKRRNRFMAYGNESPIYPVCKFQEPKKGEPRCIQINVGAALTAEVVHNQLAVPLPDNWQAEQLAPGYVHFPYARFTYAENPVTREIRSKYFEELLAEVKTRKPYKGKMYDWWYCPDGKNNEAFDEYKYAAVHAVEVWETLLHKPMLKASEDSTGESVSLVENRLERIRKMAQG